MCAKAAVAVFAHTHPRPFLAMVSEIGALSEHKMQSMHAKFEAISELGRIVPMPIRVGDD